MTRATLLSAATFAVSVALIPTATAAADTQRSIPPGSQWTFRLSGGGCEIDTFHANGTFTTAGSDRGVFAVRGSRLHMRWTQGGNATTSFAGTFTPSIRGYSGEWTAGGESIAAALTPGRTCV
jgi:hypothetical protein